MIKHKEKQFSFRLPVLRKLLFAVELLATFFIFSSFNPLDDPSKMFDKEVKSIAIQWYQLFLELESKDLTAYPPLSAERLAKMGISGYIALHSHNAADTKSKSVLANLNHTYSKSLSEFYSFMGTPATDKILQLESDLHQTICKDGCKNIHMNTSKIQIEGFLQNEFNNPESKACVAYQSPNIQSTEYFKGHKFHSNAPVLPEWGKKNTILINKNQIKSPKPYHNSESFEKSLYEDALSIYTLSHDLKKDDIWVAEFWGDDIRGLTFSPAGRWISIANQILVEEDLTANDVITIYLKLGIGLNDAGVICWQNKYIYNLERPSTYIQNNINSSWEPFHADPEFPSYPSGHSVFGAVACGILEHYFGKEYKMTDMSHANRNEFFGKERTFHSFNEMAHENAYSRMLMGVHYKLDCDEGLRLGYEIAEVINNFNFEKLFVSNRHFL